MANIERYNAHIEFETTHRKRWLKRAVLSRRYIKGIINTKIKESIHSRKTGDTTTDPIIRARVIEKTRGKCYLCLRQYNPSLALLLPRLYFAKIQIDHIIPFSRGGSNALSNYLVSCSECNRKKSDLSLAEYKAGVKRAWRIKSFK